MSAFSFRQFRRGSPIVVVSGLPRSGTSMMMQMLDAAPWPILSDGQRTADDHNPLGYYELEAVKSMHEAADSGWLKDARGKAVKVVSFLLTWLPEDFDYRVIFMRRDLREVVRSQQAMLQSSSDEMDVDRLVAVYTRHLEEVATLIRKRSCFTVLDVEHAAAIADPRAQARRVASFLGHALDVERMAAAVNPRLHRNRS